MVVGDMAGGDKVVVRGMVAAGDMAVVGMVAVGMAVGDKGTGLLHNLGNRSPFLYLSNKFRNKNCNISVM